MEGRITITHRRYHGQIQNTPLPSPAPRDPDKGGSASAKADGGHHCKLMLNYLPFSEEGAAVDNDKASAQFQVRF